MADRSFRRNSSHTGAWQLRELGKARVHFKETAFIGAHGTDVTYQIYGWYLREAVAPDPLVYGAARRTSARASCGASVRADVSPAPTGT